METFPLLGQSNRYEKGINISVISIYEIDATTWVFIPHLNKARRKPIMEMFPMLGQLNRYEKGINITVISIYEIDATTWD